MAPRSLRSSLLPLLLLAPSLSLAASNDFSFYPKNAQSCLYKAADSAACTGDTNAALNECLCSNTSGFVTDTAKCLGSEDPDDVDQVYTDMSGACSNSNTPIGVTEAEFKAAAAQGASSSADASSTTASATESATQSTTDAATTTASESKYVTTTSGGKTVTVIASQTSTNDKNKDKNTDDKKSGLSTPVTIGIGVGGAVLGAAIVGAIAFFLLRRRRKGGEESHPMLPTDQQQLHPQGGPPQYAPGMGYSDNKPAWTPGGYTPSPVPSQDPGQKNWNAPTQYPAAGYPAAGAPGLPLQQGVAPGHVFEMEGTVATAAVEMPGSVVHNGQQGHQGYQGHPGQQQGWQ